MISYHIIKYLKNIRTKYIILIRTMHLVIFYARILYISFLFTFLLMIISYYSSFNKLLLSVRPLKYASKKAVGAWYYYIFVNSTPTSLLSATIVSSTFLVASDFLFLRIALFNFLLCGLQPHFRQNNASIPPPKSLT